MSWPIGRLDRLADSWPSSVDKHSLQDEPSVRLCNYTDVYKHECITADLDFMRATASVDQIERFRLRRGDTLITKDSETADDIGVPAYVAYEAPDLVCGYHLSIVRPHAAVAWPKFVYWALASEFVRSQWEVLASGVTRVGLRRTDVARVRVPMPPVDEQRAIADYLDHETAKIDALIAKQASLAKALSERRSALIDAYLKPVHDTWQQTSLRRLLARVDQGISPQAEAGLSDPDGWGVLKSGCVNRGVFRQDEHKRLDAGFAIDQSLAIAEGDLLVSRASGSPELVGSAGVVTGLDRRLILSDKIFRLVPTESIETAFLYWADSTGRRNTSTVEVFGGDERLECEDRRRA